MYVCMYICHHHHLLTTALVFLLILAGVYAYRQKRRAERADKKNNPFGKIGEFTSTILIRLLFILFGVNHNLTSEDFISITVITCSILGLK